MRWLTPTLVGEQTYYSQDTSSLPNKRYNINLPAHMAECDTNYLRIKKLFPHLREDDLCEFGVRLGPRLTIVSMSVLERGPYTTLLRLSGREAPALSDDAVLDTDEAPVTHFWAAHPRMTVRLYHDARCAEVVDYQRARHFQAVYAYPNPGMRQPDEKAQVNRFLGEFLALCLECGLITDAALSEASPAT